MQRMIPAVIPAQTSPTDPVHLYLLPLTDTPVRLLTHTLDVSIRSEDEATILRVVAGYRLHNATTENQTVLLQVSPSPTQSAQPMPEGVNLSIDGQALTLQPTGEGFPQTGQISIAADARRQLTLSYQTQIRADDFGIFRYTSQLLNAWAGRPESWRITIDLPGENSGWLPSESWVSTSPASWTYNGDRLQWLQEGAFPDEPFVLQWIAPTLWRSLAETRQALSTEPTPARFLALGDFYNRLYGSPKANGSTRLRFYAQALAAYSDGVAFGQQTGLPPAQMTALHRALASLYRSRSIGADGRIDPAYIDLMVAEVQRALNALPPDDSLRAELTQWLAQGLETQFRLAQQQADWSQASIVLEEMTALPNFDPAWLASERQMIELQQALTFLEQDNQDAAITLAGADILNESMLPPPESRAIFATWQVTLTLAADETTLHLAAAPVEGRQETAQLVANQLAQAWLNADVQGTNVSFLGDGQLAIDLSGVALAEHRLALTQSVPPLADWALLRTLLTSLDPAVSRSHQWLWERVEISQRMDLRAVSDQWRGVAALLERQAADIQFAFVAANAQATNAQAIDAVQAEISEQLRQIYLIREAQIWQNAVRSSAIRIQMAPNSADTPARIWIAQLDDAPQTLSLQTEVLSGPRLLLAVVILLTALLALAGLLWLLL
ncbi:MAG: hypothetical protein KDD84_01010 [Caldilineaceae bacterium]|nr:hypothetical protein [Caldilineaceae bacterium]